MVIITRAQRDLYKCTQLKDLFPALYQRLLDLTEQQRDTTSEMYREIETIREGLTNLQCCLVRMQSRHTREIERVQQVIEALVRTNDNIKIPIVCKSCGTHLVDATVALLETTNAHYAHLIDTGMCYQCYEIAELQERAALCTHQIDTLLSGAVYSGCSVTYGDADRGYDYLYFSRRDPDTNAVQEIAVKIRHLANDDMFDRKPIEHILQCVVDATTLSEEDE